jgi:hypothetical protein
MSIAVRQVINHAFQLAGVLDLDESADGSDGAAAVIILNELIGQLNIDQLLPFSQQVETYTVASTKNAYTIGTTGTTDIVADSPSFVERILYQTSSGSNPISIQGVDLPDLLSVARSQNQGTPSCFAVNETYPNSTIYFDVALTGGTILTIIYNKSFPAYTINDTILAPPSYSDLFVTGTARKICVLKKMPAETLQSIDILWKEAKDRIKKNNGRRQTPMLNMGFMENIFSYDATWGR